MKHCEIILDVELNSARKNTIHKIMVCPYRFKYAMSRLWEPFKQIVSGTKNKYSVVLKTYHLPKLVAVRFIQLK